MEWHPHLNALVEGGFLEIRQMVGIQQEISEALGLGWDVDLNSKGGVKKIRSGVIAHYEYVQRKPGVPIAEDEAAQGHMLHNARYIEKPTFLNPEWDLQQIAELHNFRNSSWWGHWKDEPKWQLQERSEADSLWWITKLAQGECPHCGTPIRWTGIVRMKFAEEAGWVPLGGGYFEIIEQHTVDPTGRQDEIYALTGEEER
jgi:hypothetical protein